MLLLTILLKSIRLPLIRVKLRCWQVALVIAISFCERLYLPIRVTPVTATQLLTVYSYDLRTSSPLGRTTLKFGLNKIVFNPMEPMNFVVASEDHNLYGTSVIQPRPGYPGRCRRQSIQSSLTSRSFRVWISKSYCFHSGVYFCSNIPSSVGYPISQ